MVEEKGRFHVCSVRFVLAGLVRRWPHTATYRSAGRNESTTEDSSKNWATSHPAACPPHCGAFAKKRSISTNNPRACVCVRARNERENVQDLGK
jgi:hypothetical protein